jgi:hypothetical protein
VALLQEGACDPQAPVCSVHVTLWDISRGTTRVIRPDEPLTSNLRWTQLGLSISLPQGPQQGTLLWDGQNWSSYSPHRLWITDASGTSLLVQADAGSIGGRVWRREQGQESVLSTIGSVEYPLGLSGAESIVARDEAPTVLVVTYRAGSQDRVVHAPGPCLAAQRRGQWLLCTNSGTAALAYSLDGHAFARHEIPGVGSFSALAALPDQ